MISLIIDTSTDCALIALAKEDVVIGIKNIFTPKQLSKMLLQEVNTLLEECQASLQEITYFAVGVGPGSYTGTRVGSVVAQTLSFALNKPLLTFSSIKAFLPEEKDNWGWVMPAKSGNYYFLKKTDKHFYHKLLKREELISQLTEIETVICPDFESLAVPLNPHCNKQNPILNPQLLAKILHKKFLEGQFSLEAKAELIYLH